MTEAEHTPPPWEVIEGDFAPDGHARYTMGHYWLRATDAKFAASPEMFRRRWKGKRAPWIDVRRHWWIRASKCKAKARGETDDTEKITFRR